MDVKNKHITVVGGARSGLAVAKLLTHQGAKVFLTDKSNPTEGIEEALQAIGAEYEFGAHTTRVFDADLFAISPGVPSTVPIVQQALKIGIPVYSEIEVASWFCPAPIVAITGSNGKTTTTSLVAHIFKTARRNYIVGGNIGFPFSDYVEALSPDSSVILEVSSFQLDHIESFRPRVSVLLNITPDHLDRYDYDFNKYAQSKFRIFENQGDGDWLIYSEDDELVREYVNSIRAKRTFNALGFSLDRELEQGAFLRNGEIIIRINEQEERLMRPEEISIRGRHNLYNSLAAAVASRVMEIRSDVIRESLMGFEGVPHRLEFVREINGVKYYNDSKATNVNAVWYALESFDEPMILIAGGRDKGNDYASLKALVKEKVRCVIGLGDESGHKVIEDLGSAAAESSFANTMEEAIRMAHQKAKAGDVVLLSPACASFDMFQNYEDRGDTFKRLVNSL
jgi:UDP-N-acetylmuramoylalanine--D-glutamate ligase